ncbi:universal stress protein [Kitasatospora sp. NPDC088346]|uniref:universal stress protein n=1 Tax=Kitasatospora sp. NPDC088346 TaxID=3364073 RepID=UPI0037FF1C6A
MAHPVIVGVDYPESAGAAVDWAADEARSRGMRLHLVHAWLWEPDQAPESLDAEAARRTGEDALRVVAERAVARHPDIDVSSGFVDTSPREALVALSAEAGVLVLGSRGPTASKGCSSGPPVCTSLRTPPALPSSSGHPVPRRQRASRSGWRDAKRPMISSSSRSTVPAGTACRCGRSMPGATR